MTFIIHADMELWDFMLDGLRNRSDIKEFPLNRYCNKFHRFIRQYYPNLKIPSSLIIGKEIRDELKNLVSGDKVVISAYTQLCLFHAIKKIVKDGVQICLWMWNPISSNSIFKKNIELLRNEGVSLHTFDTKDSEEYSMVYHNTFYNMNVDSHSSNIMYDFYFLGAAKKRRADIEKLKNVLRKYRCYFLIPSSTDDFITYEKNLSNIRESHCIVEIVQNKQYDITLRPLEALAFKKKLLTNNYHIKRYPFYNKQNIFILGEDDIQHIGDFLNSPYVEIDDSVVKQFDVNSWIDSF